MLAIMQAESSCEQSKANLSAGETHKDINGNVVCVGSYSLLQIGCVHYLQNPEDLLDPTLNIQVGYEVWKKQGYNAWTVYQTGKYLKYL